LGYTVSILFLRVFGIFSIQQEEMKVISTPVMFRNGAIVLIDGLE
jgi:hypothetical protein